MQNRYEILAILSCLQDGIKYVYSNKIEKSRDWTYFYFLLLVIIKVILRKYYAFVNNAFYVCGYTVLGINASELVVHATLAGGLEKGK